MPSRLNPNFTKSLALLLASTSLSTVPAMAQDIGTAAAVNTLSQSTPPGEKIRVLQIGARVVHNERIQTSASGTVQLLFLDKTTLSVGPNSILVIDNFVYDPATGTGQGDFAHQGRASFCRRTTQPPGGGHGQHARCHDWNSRGNRDDRAWSGWNPPNQSFWPAR